MTAPGLRVRVLMTWPGKLADINAPSLLEKVESDRAFAVATVIAKEENGE